MRLEVRWHGCGWGAGHAPLDLVDELVQDGAEFGSTELREVPIPRAHGVPEACGVMTLTRDNPRVHDAGTSSLPKETLGLLHEARIAQRPARLQHGHGVRKRGREHACLHVAVRRVGVVRPERRCPTQPGELRQAPRAETLPLRR